MHKGVAIWNYHRGGDNHRENMENARFFYEHGFDAVSWHGHEFDCLNEEQGAELAEFLKETGMVLTAHHILPDPEDKEHVKRFGVALENMAAWQQKYKLLNGLTFDFWYPHATTLPYLGDAIRTFRGLGSFIACEDTPMNERKYEQFLPYLTSEDDFGILIDLGHMNFRMNVLDMHEPEDLMWAFKRLPLKVREIHISDNKGRRDDHMYVGWGCLPVDAMGKALHAVGFDGIVTMELVNPNNTWTLDEHRAHCLKGSETIVAAIKP